MANIRSRMARAAVVLFSDDEVFNKNITGVRTLEDVKDIMRIKGTLRQIANYGDTLAYKLVGSDYNFEIRFINEGAR